jgi:hypothetical protein
MHGTALASTRNVRSAATFFPHYEKASLEMEGKRERNRNGKGAEICSESLA